MIENHQKNQGNIFQKLQDVKQKKESVSEKESFLKNQVAEAQSQKQELKN